MAHWLGSFSHACHRQCRPTPGKWNWTKSDEKHLWVMPLLISKTVQLLFFPSCQKLPSRGQASASAVIFTIGLDHSPTLVITNALQLQAHLVNEIVFCVCPFCSHSSDHSSDHFPTLVIVNALQAHVENSNWKQFDDKCLWVMPF